jgi:hypothetical protein
LTLTHQEKKIISYLERWHEGKGKATTFSRLAGNLDIPERELREIVAHLVVIHEQLIGTTSTDGYFMISNFEEFHHVDDELTKRFTSLILRRSGLRRGWARRTAGQQQFEFKTEEAI